MTAYNKLVRDRIPDIIQRGGGQASTRLLSDAEFASALSEKLVEEAREFAETRSIEELADVLEVIRAAASLIGSSIGQVEAPRQTKATERGSFDRRVYLESVTSGET